jgi:hypothetical protein
MVAFIIFAIRWAVTLTLSSPSPVCTSALDPAPLTLTFTPSSARVPK